MSVKSSDSQQWFGAMVAAYGVRSAVDKAEAVHTWADRVKAALRGETATDHNRKAA